MVSSGGWIDGSKVSKKIWLRILAQFNRMGLSIILFTNPGILKISCIFYFNLFHMLAYFHPVLDSCGCCTKLSQIHWVKTTPIYSPSVLECNLFSFSSPSVNPMCLWQDSAPCCLSLLAAAAIPWHSWLMAASPQSLSIFT